MQILPAIALAVENRELSALSLALPMDVVEGDVVVDDFGVVFTVLRVVDGVVELGGLVVLVVLLEELDVVVGVAFLLITCPSDDDDGSVLMVGKSLASRLRRRFYVLLILCIFSSGVNIILPH